MVGLTTDTMLKKKESKSRIQSYSDREAALWEFLKAEGHSSRCTVFPIDSTEGGADTMPDIDALIVSDEPSVIENAIRINGLRLKNGLKRFQIVIVPRVLTEDNVPVSSSRERRGEKLDPSRFRY